MTRWRAELLWNKDVFRWERFRHQHWKARTTEFRRTSSVTVDQWRQEQWRRHVVSRQAPRDQLTVTAQHNTTVNNVATSITQTAGKPECWRRYSKVPKATRRQGFPSPLGREGGNFWILVFYRTNIIFLRDFNAHVTKQWQTQWLLMGVMQACMTLLGVILPRQKGQTCAFLWTCKLQNCGTMTLKKVWHHLSHFFPCHFPSGVARICCEEGQSWKLVHGALTANFRAGCSSWSMINSFVLNAVLIERAVSCWHLLQLISQTTQYLDSWLSDLLQSKLKIKLLEVEGARALVPHSWRRLHFATNGVPAKITVARRTKRTKIGTGGNCRT